MHKDQEMAELSNDLAEVSSTSQYFRYVIAQRIRCFALEKTRM